MHENTYIELAEKKVWVRKLNYNTSVNAPVLVFLHEGLGSVEKWKDFPEKLCKRLGLNGILYDREGYGRSSRTSIKRPLDYLEREALDVLPKFLEQCNITKPILFGHSDGGTIALIYAAHHPTLALIAEAAHIKVETATLNGIEQALQEPARSQLSGKLNRYHGDKTDELLCAWGRIWLSKAFRSWNIEALLPQITCPSLVIQGEKDEYASVRHLHDIVKGIGSHATSLLIKGVGHVPHRNSEEEVLKASANFILSALAPAINE